MRECDTERRYPYEAYEKVARLGWLRLLIPEEQGGDGGTIFDYALMCEGLARYGFDFATAFMVSTFTAMNVVKFGTDAQRAKSTSGPFMRGERRFSISISEPSAGSDAANTRTRAERNGDDWVITGQKLWCSGAAAKRRNHCDAGTYRSLMRKSITGLSVMLVPNDTPGLDMPQACPRWRGAPPARPRYLRRRCPHFPADVASWANRAKAGPSSPIIWNWNASRCRQPMSETRSRQ